jgi:phosphomannomutase / phosphoglucomutase
MVNYVRKMVTWCIVLSFTATNTIFAYDSGKTHTDTLRPLMSNQADTALLLSTDLSRTIYKSSSSGISKDIFQSMDIRSSNADLELDDETCIKIGKAYGSFLRNKKGLDKNLTVVVGHDVRISSPRIHKAFIQGVISIGVNVIDITGNQYSLSSTPLMYFSIRHYNADGGVEVTASHLPQEFNGLKMMLGLNNLSGSDIKSLYQACVDEDFIASPAPGKLVIENPLPAYISSIQDMFKQAGVSLEGWRLAVDVGNGTTQFAKDLYEGLGAEVELLFPEPDGTFPNHVPDPDKPENLQSLAERVKQIHHEESSKGVHAKRVMGIAFDTDGDRVGFVTEQGEVCSGNHTLALLAQGALKQQPGANVMICLRAAKAVEDAIHQMGGVPIIGPVGYGNLRKLMVEMENDANNPSQVVFAGEDSGHVLYTDNDKIDDGMYTSAKLLISLASQQDSMSTLMTKLVPTFAKTKEARMLIKGDVDSVRNATLDDFEKTLTAEGYQITRLPQFPEQVRAAKITTVDGADINSVIVARSSLHEPVMCVHIESGYVDSTNADILPLLENNKLMGASVLDIIKRHPEIEQVPVKGKYTPIFQILADNQARINSLTKSSSAGAVDEIKLKAAVTKIIGSGDAGRARAAIEAEAAITGRSESAVVRGIIGRDQGSDIDDDWLMANNPLRGPPSDILYVGGGGEGITTFIQAIVNTVKKTTPYKQFKKLIRKVAAAINNGGYDDGGNTATVRMDLHDSGHWPMQVNNFCGDIMSIVSYGTDDEAKIYFLDDKFRIDARVNVNDADIDTFRSVLDKRTAEAVVAERGRLGKDFEVVEVVKDGKVKLHFPEIERIIVAVNGKENGAIIYKVIQSTLMAEGKSKTSVFDAAMERFINIQKKIDAGAMARPADWIFFVSNMLAYAMIIDEYLIKTHDIRLLGSKWQNLMDLAARIEVGQIARGKMDIDFSKSIDKLYEALGIPAIYTKGVSRDDATMVAILEASALKIKGTDGNEDSAVLIGYDGTNKDILIKPSQVEVSGDVMAMPLRVAKTTKRVKDGRSISMVLGGRKVRFENKKGILHVTIDNKVALSIMEKEEGATIIRINGEQPKSIRLDAIWDDFEIGDIHIGMKSRMVVEQTFITDEVLSSRVNRLFYKRAVRKDDGSYDYLKTDEGHDRLHTSGTKKLRRFESLKPESYPVIDESTKRLIQEARKAIVFGEGGMITSLLPNFLVHGVMEEISAKINGEGLAGVWYPKLTEDFETKGLSLHEQMEVLDHSIRMATGCTIGFSDIVTDIILPEVPERIIKRAGMLFEEAEKVYDEHKDDIASRKEKISKYYPMGLMPISEEDIAYFRKKGIKVHYVSNFDFNSKKKLVWDKKELYRTIELIATRRALLNMIDDDARRAACANKLESVNSSFSGPLFWPVSEWHTIFTEIARNKNTETVSMVFNKGQSDESIINVKIPSMHKLLSPRQKEVIAQYITVSIYNHLVSIGAKSLTVHSNSWVFEMVSDNFKRDNARGYGLIFDFLAMRNNGEDFVLSHEKAPIALKPVSRHAGHSVKRRDIGKDTVVGIDLNDHHIRAILLDKGNIIDTKEVKWNPHNPDDYNKLSEVVRKFNVDIKSIDRIGISCANAVDLAGRAIGRMGSVTGYAYLNKEQQEALDIAVNSLSEKLSQDLGGVPVRMFNNGDALAYFLKYEDKNLKNALVLGVDSRLSASYINNRGQIADILGELGNIIIDMNVDAPGHNYTHVKGVLQQYLSSPAFVRLGRELLMGDLMPGEVYNSIGRSFELSVEKQDDKMREYSIEPDSIFRKTRNTMTTREREIYDGIIEDISMQFAEAIPEFQRRYSNVWAIFLPSSILALTKDGDPGIGGRLNKEAIRLIAEKTKLLIDERYDSRIAILLDDDMDFNDVYMEWREHGSPQSNIVMESVAAYFAESIMEVKKMFPATEKVILTGRAILMDLGSEIAKLTEKILRKEYEVNTVKVSVTSTPTSLRTFESAKGAAYMAASIDEESPKSSSSGNIDDAVDKILDHLKAEDMVDQMQTISSLPDKITADEMARLRKRHPNNKFLNIGFDTQIDKNTGQVVSYLNRLGWTTDTIQSLLDNPGLLAEVLTQALKIRGQYRYVIFCGMGGSRLCIDTVKGVFGEPKDISMFTLGTTDSSTIDDILNAIAEDAGSLQEGLRRTLVVPISKSGTTKETTSHKDYFESLFTSTALFGEDTLNPIDHLLFITDQGSSMEKEAVQRGIPYLYIQLNKTQDAQWKDISRTNTGGRYTAPGTTIPLLPFALIAGDNASHAVIELLENAVSMNSAADISDDVFIKLGAFLYYMAAVQGKDKLTFILPEALKAIAPWAEQLFEESLGKDNKGITIIYDENLSPDKLKSPADNDRVFLRFKLYGKPEPQAGLWRYLSEKGYPVRDIEVAGIESLGGIELGLQRAVATVGYLWGINFVDQPSVEGYKNATRAVMDALKPGEHVTIPYTSGAEYNSLTLYWQPLLDASAIDLSELQQEVASLGSDMDDGPAVYAAIVRILIRGNAIEVVELAPWANMTIDFEQAMRDIRDNVFTTGLKMPSKLAIHPDGNHSFQQNVEGGRNIFFSTYLLGMEMRQPNVKTYEPELLKAQAIGTINSMVENKRKVVLLTTDGELDSAHEDIKAFFGQVEKYLVKSSSSGVFDNEISPLRQLVKRNTGGLIAINPLDYSEGPERVEIEKLYDKNSRELQDLERELGCTIRLVSQIAEVDIKGKEVVSISYTDISLPYSELATKIKRIGIEAGSKGHYPLAFVVGMATQLFGDKTLHELVQALNANRRFEKIFGQPATNKMIQSFLNTGIFELPIPRFDYEKVENLQRSALMALMAA